MRAEAVLYVGDLPRMRRFYEGCFGLTAVDATDGYCSLGSEAWLLTLVRSAEAVPSTNPAPRRTRTPVKLAFETADIEALRPVVASLGGEVDPAGTIWTFGSTARCDCVDPEGNVLQLIEPHRR